MNRPNISIIMIDDDPGDIRIVERILDHCTTWQISFQALNDVTAGMQAIAGCGA